MGRSKKTSDNSVMTGNKKLFSLLILISLIVSQNAFGAVAKYKEDYYKLYHTHYQLRPDDCLENIWYLEQAVKSDFANPYYALVHINNEEEWEKYRYLFQMHLNLNS